MKIGRFYLKTTDTKLYHEVNVYEDMSVKVFSRPLRQQVKHLVWGLFSLLLSKKTTNEQYQTDLTLKSFDIIDAQNIKRVREGLKPVSEKKIIEGIVKANGGKIPKAKKKKSKKLTAKQKQKEEYNKKPNYIG
jgi:hypothetical protein